MYDRYMKFIDRGVVWGCGSQFKVLIGPSGVARLDLIAIAYKGKLYGWGLLEPVRVHHLF